MKICWFTTGRDKEAVTLLQDVNDAIEKKAIDGEIALVFMNRDRGESPVSDEIIAYAEGKKIPLELFGTKRFLGERGMKLSEGRELFDGEVRSRISRYDFDIIFLAGYMLIVSKVLFEPYTVINLHPSLPNAYKGKWEDVIRNTIEDGERTFGAMIHMVDASLDEGAPVSFVKLALEGRDIDTFYDNAFRGDATSKDRLFKIIRDQEFSIEIPLIIHTLSLLSKGEITIDNKKVYSKGKELTGGVDITEIVCSSFQCR
ncbi:MAG: Phosphoribosylglycinamide formyltransferase [Syntrophorhabdus sp. PtaU1.Bin058]|nr:MAG: Phosphoribosylglycinamide formyltransferase [Syntrophorhabdus sp. PtaU1.Bin058]